MINYIAAVAADFFRPGHRMRIRLVGGKTRSALMLLMFVPAQTHFSALAQSRLLSPGARPPCPYSGSGWPDGCPAAPAGSPQYLNLLNGYGPHRPPWNVAGVDYHVGVPDGAILRDWRTLSGTPHLSVDTARGVVTLTGDFDFENIDFSLGVGAIIYNTGAANITINNCNFQLQPSSPMRAAYLINDSNKANVIITNSNINGTNMTDPPSFISVGRNITLKYNYFKGSRGQILQFTTTVGGTITYHDNFIDDTTPPCGQHMNYHQLSSNNNSSVADTVSFNTTYQHSLGGAEGFQFYFNGNGRTISPVLQNNTMIALPHTPARICPPVTYGPQTVSYFIRGGRAGGTGGKNNNNYFDISGAFGAYAPGTMTNAQGWSSSGNIDMKTGAIITPK